MQAHITVVATQRIRGEAERQLRGKLVQIVLTKLKKWREAFASCRGGLANVFRDCVILLH
jgi:hypothetical protein